MYSTILLPLDGSAVAERALPYAVALARASGARLLLLGAVRTRTNPDRRLTHDQAHAAHAARTHLASVAARLDRRIVVETVVFPAPLAEAISREARVRNVDLIVMTSRGQSWPGRDRDGRIPAQIVRRAEVSVLLIPAAGACSWPLDRRLRLLAPCDVCACAAEARRYADDLAATLGAELCVLRVAAPPHGAAASISPSSAVMGETTPCGPEAPAPGLWAGGPAVVARGGEDDRAALASIAHARGADMVVLPIHVCGSPPHRDMDRASLQLLQHAHIPLLLVRPAAGRKATGPAPAATA